MSVQSVQAPIAGINSIDALDDMRPDEAVYLDNWFPDTGYCRMRGGSSEFRDTGGANVGTVAPFQSSTGNLLVACVDDKVVDVTALTPVSLGTGFGSPRWQYEVFSDRLLLFNGVDPAQEYNGTTLAAISFSGSVTPAAIVGGISFKGRMYYWQNSETAFHYAAAGSYSGATSQFDLSIASRTGGVVINCFSWSMDAGDGLDDFFVALLSTGEALVYQGEDPADVQAWALVGRYQMGEPINIRGTVDIAGDVLILTRTGWVSFKHVLRVGETQQDPVTRKIERFARDAAALYSENEYWDTTFYPTGPYVLINIPELDGSTYVQHVMNTNTGAWGTFSGWVSNTYAVYDGALLFGSSDGKIYLADAGTNDSGLEIITDALPAYNYLSGRANNKKLTGIRPITNSSEPENIVITGSADFSIPNRETTPPSTKTPALTPWGSPWGSPWEDSASQTTDGEWRSVNEYGYALSYRMNQSSNYEQVLWLSTQVMYEDGGVI